MSTPLNVESSNYCLLYFTSNEFLLDKKTASSGKSAEARQKYRK